MPEMPKEFLAQVRKIAQGLDALDYFQVLRVEKQASYEQIREAYHKQARIFHPDKYHHLADAALLADVTAISKRVSEAYVVLRDADKRERYRKDVEGPERAARLRYTEQSDQAVREEKDAQVGSTPQGRQMYLQAVVKWQNGDKAGALQSLKMALVYEAQNPAFKAKLEEWSRS